jgi:hypothetical protein
MAKAESKLECEMDTKHKKKILELAPNASNSSMRVRTLATADFIYLLSEAIAESAFPDKNDMAEALNLDDNIIYKNLAACLEVLSGNENGRWKKLLYELLPETIPPLETPNHDLPALVEEHWADEFSGGAIKGILDRFTAFDEVFKKEGAGASPQGAFYAKVLNLIQSSGVGKSRSVDELGKQLLGVTFVLRRDGETGYPPGDPSVLQFLTCGNTRKDNVHQRAVALIATCLNICM